MTQEVLAPGIPRITRQDVDAIAARHGEPSWLKERRTAAWERYEAMDLPDAGDEEWRRTDVRALPLDSVRPVATETRVEAVDSPVVFVPLATAVEKHPELVQKHLFATVQPDEWKYLALNAALFEGGTVLYVPKGVEVEVPLRTLTTGPQGEDAAMFSRTLVVLEENARAALIDESVSPDGQRGFFSGAVEIVLGDGAKLAYYDINRWGYGVYNFKTVRAHVGRDAEFLGMAAGIGSKLTKMRIESIMPKSGARTQLLGVTFGDGDQHFDYNTLQDHIGNHTISDLQFKSALTDGASLVWYGVTRIQPTAGGSEANQTSRNLLLSERAKAAPIPILEIAAYDVSKCSHGATAGPVDEEQLYYLQARAIPRQVAEQMLVEGFFADVVDRVPDERLRGRIMGAVLAKAGGSAGALSWDDVLST